MQTVDEIADQGQNVVTWPPASLQRPQLSNHTEIELICSCARTNIDAKTAEYIKALVLMDLNWECVLERARGNGVLPLLYYNLNSICPDLVPPNILDRLRNVFHAHARRNLLLVKELIRVSQLLERHNISAIPFKGPILAASLYKNISLRSFCDLDILVKQEDVLQTIGLLAGEGYNIQGDFADAEKVVYALPRKKDFRLMNDSVNVAIELHWRITGKRFRFSFDMDRLWDRLDRVPLGGAELLNFCPEDLFLILCVHGSKHLWGHLLWITDIAELIRAYPEMNWERLIKQAQYLGSERMLLLGMYVARDILQADLPALITEKIQNDPMVRQLGSQVRATIWKDRNVSVQELHMHRFHIKMRERIWDKAMLGFYYGPKYLRALFKPTAVDEEFISLPVSLHFIYYVLRPVRLVKQFCSSLWSKYVRHSTRL